MRYTVQIEEGPDYWTVTSFNGTERVATAATALSTVKLHGERLAAQGIDSIITIEWIPKTHIGRSIVRALQ